MVDLGAPLLLPQRCRQSAATHTQLLLLVLLFILWGACNALNDVLIRTFKTAFTLTDYMSSLVQSAFYFGYLAGGLPAACIARRYGYKICVCAGLGLVCAGAAAFWPVSRVEQPSYTGLLGCLYLLAFGLAFLETSANPWIVLLAERQRVGSGTKALNIAQSFNPVGSVLGVLLGRQLILGASHPVEEVGHVYMILAITFACVAIAFVIVRFPAGDGRGGARRQALGCGHVVGCLRSRGFRCGLGAQFLNIGAQTCVWSFTIRYVMVEQPGTSEQRAGDALLLSLCLFLAGRWASSALLNCLPADMLLAAQCALAALCCLIASVAGGVGGLVALVMISPCFGMAFPTIFALSMAHVDAEHAEVGASLLVMSIIGGALVTPLMGLVSDAAGSVRVAYTVPMVCFLCMAAFGWAHARHWFSSRAPRASAVEVSVSMPDRAIEAVA